MIVQLDGANIVYYKCDIHVYVSHFYKVAKDGEFISTPDLTL